MSKFLGKIHYWLHNKIKYTEELELAIEQWASEQKDLPVSKWREELNNKYGAPLGDEPLEEIIDTANIHGWLQDKISRAELRGAELITNIINVSEDYKDDLVQIFKRDAYVRAVGARELYPISNPEDLYKVLNEYILEGMPCDPIDKRVENTDKTFKWLTSYCIHEQYWNKVRGDVKNFNALREGWVTEFLNVLSNEYSFEIEHVDGKRLNIIKKIQ